MSRGDRLQEDSNGGGALMFKWTKLRPIGPFYPSRSNIEPISVVRQSMRLGMDHLRAYPLTSLVNFITFPSVITTFETTAMFFNPRREISVFSQNPKTRFPPLELHFFAFFM